MRKIFIAFISLAAISVIYLFYSRVSKTPPIPVDTDTGVEFIDSAAERVYRCIKVTVRIISLVFTATSILIEIIF